MSESKEAILEEKESIAGLEYCISQFLRFGVLLAGGFLAVGWCWLLVQGNSKLTGFSNYESESLFESVRWSLFLQDRGKLLTFIGLGILVALPVLRVLLTGVIFIAKREYRMAATAFIVFSVLILSFLLGIDS